MKKGAKSTFRGHSIYWNGSEWRYTDNDIKSGFDGEVRPCKRCGKLFEGSNNGDADPCLGELPGVDNACCGHGDPDNAYIRFMNGVIIRGFTVEKKADKEAIEWPRKNYQLKLENKSLQSKLDKAIEALRKADEFWEETDCIQDLDEYHYKQAVTENLPIYRAKLSKALKEITKE